MPAGTGKRTATTRLTIRCATLVANRIGTGKGRVLHLVGMSGFPRLHARQVIA